MFKGISQWFGFGDTKVASSNTNSNSKLKYKSKLKLNKTCHPLQGSKGKNKSSVNGEMTSQLSK